MQLLNICTKKDYKKDGEKKTKWYKVGVLKIADNGKKFIKLFQQPYTEFFVFDNEDNKRDTNEETNEQA